MNKCLGNYLHCFSSTKPTSLCSWLPWAEFCYNTSYHVSFHTTPFKIVYVRDPPTICCYDHPKSLVDDIDRYLQERDQVLALLKEHLSNAQAIMKATKDSGRRDVSLKEGDLVYLKLQPYRLRALSKRFNEKLPQSTLALIQLSNRLMLSPISWHCRLIAASTQFFMHPN